MRKIFLVISLSLNVYLLVTLRYHAPFGLEGGRTLHIPSGQTARLSSVRDIFGVYKFYRLALYDSSNILEDVCLVQPINVIPWYDLREREYLLSYDELKKEVVVTIDNYEMRWSVNKPIELVITD